VNTHQQHGQALISGLLVLALASIFGWFVVQNNRAASTAVSKRIENRLKAIHECQSKAHILNEISLTNIAILASLSQAANAFAESAQWNFNTTATRPWWKKDSDHDELDRDKKIFDALSKRVEKSLHTARSLTQKNRALASKLARGKLQLLDALTTESPPKSMCRAIAMAGVTPKNSGIIRFAKPITALIPTLEWRNCLLTSFLGTTLNISNEMLGWPTSVSDFGILTIKNINEARRFQEWMQTCAQANNSESIEVIHPIMKKVGETCGKTSLENCEELTTIAFLQPHWTAARNADNEKENLNESFHARPSTN
jgi:hypothetical protein